MSEKELRKKIENARKIVTIEFINDVMESIDTKFTYTNMSNQQITHLLLNEVERVPEIHIVYPKWRWSKMIAYTDSTHDIYINGYKTHTICSLVGSIVHERSHMAGFSHGSNRVRWYNKTKKMNSVPYKAGRTAKRLCKMEDMNG